MPSHVQHFVTLFRNIVLIAVTALWIASAALPIAAQNSVPANAVEAAKTPEVAARLAHPTRKPATRPQPARASQRSHPDLTPGLVYDNGPINGSVDAWTINFGFAVTDSFTLGSATTITGFQFGAWDYPGDTPVSVDYLIGTSPFGGAPATVSLSSQYLFTNPDGFYVNQETATGLNVVLGPGTYWLTLQNAVVNTGNPLYWDENSGPSLAQDNEIGTIPSESFSVQGDTTGEPGCFSAQGKLQIIFDLTSQQGGGDGVAIDHAGNLYGTSVNGGSDGEGLAYKLTHFAGWLLDPLFNFVGGNTGGQPNGAILGPNGSLYGGARGGIQNCGSDGSQYCGVVYNLTPPPIACRSALCGWNENVPYRFTSESDGFGPAVGAFDPQGNLYGTTTTGGAHDLGTVFELRPSGGSWTKTTLYSFNGARDGTYPTQVLVGLDGNLYGLAAGGAFGGGVVFQLTPSGGQWTQSVVHAFGGVDGDSSPGSLVQDAAGNLYGIAVHGQLERGAIFALVKTGSAWTFSQTIVSHNEFDVLNNLVIDAAGNLYGTGNDFSTIAGDRGYKGPGGIYESYDSYVFKASFAGGNWQYQDVIYLANEVLDSGGSLALDPSGNLYGTTAGCGTHSNGTVWQVTP